MTQLKFEPPSDEAIDNLANRMHYYEVVRFFARQAYQQAQAEMILILRNARDTTPWLPIADKESRS